MTRKKKPIDKLRAQFLSLKNTSENEAITEEEIAHTREEIRKLQFLKWKLKTKKEIRKEI